MTIKNNLYDFNVFKREYVVMKSSKMELRGRNKNVKRGNCKKMKRKNNNENSKMQQN